MTGVREWTARAVPVWAWAQRAGARAAMVPAVWRALRRVVRQWAAAAEALAAARRWRAAVDRAAGARAVVVPAVGDRAAADLAAADPAVVDLLVAVDPLAAPRHG